MCELSAQYVSCCALGQGTGAVVNRIKKGTAFAAHTTGRGKQMINRPTEVVFNERVNKSVGKEGAAGRIQGETSVKS